MKSYEILKKAIPQKANSRVAQLLGISADYVRRWRRPPTADGTQGSGQRSILDRICELIDAVYLINPKGVALIVHFINAHYERLIDLHIQPLNDIESIAACSSDLLTQSTEAINSLNLEGCTDATLRELVELRDSADRAIRSVEKTLGAGTQQSPKEVL